MLAACFRRYISAPSSRSIGRLLPGGLRPFFPVAHQLAFWLVICRCRCLFISVIAWASLYFPKVDLDYSLGIILNHAVGVVQVFDQLACLDQLRLFVLHELGTDLGRVLLLLAPCNR